MILHWALEREEVVRLKLGVIHDVLSSLLHSLGGNVVH